MAVMSYAHEMTTICDLYSHEMLYEGAAKIQTPAMLLLKHRVTKHNVPNRAHLKRQ